MAMKIKNLSNTAVWILLALLILGLAGFGATNLSGTVRTVGKVGDKSIDIDRYARALSQEIRAAEAESGETLTFADAQARGLDRAVLRQLMNARALDHETDQLGLSIGDANLRDQIVEIPAFQGVNGSFDREAYRFALERAGLSESQFEEQLREETTRTMLQGAILSGVQMPASYADTLLGYLAETRDITWARLGRDDLDDPLPTPDDRTLRAYYEANQDAYMLPETKRITFAVLSPDMLLDEVEIDEDLLRAEYDARRAEFVQPERRLVERLVFPDEDAAAQAAAGIAADDTTFEALVEARGLALADVDLGDVGRLELDAAGEAVFAAEVGDVVGPLPSELGPALFRVNGVLPAQTVTFAQAQAQLRDTLAADRARRLVDAQIQNLDDLLAGGATLEELADETDMQLGSIDWFFESGEGIAAYNGFRDAAAKLTQEDFPQVEELEDGGIFAMRLDETLAPRPAPFDEARENVLANWEAEQAGERLTAQAEAVKPELDAGKDFADLGLEPMVEEGLLRSGYVPGTPPRFMEEVFAMEPGEVKIIDSFGTVLIVRLDTILPASENAEAQGLKVQLQDQVNEALARNLFSVFAADTTLRAGPQIDQRALQAVHANFP